MRKWFYERNSELIDSPVNKTFEELLWMSKDEFRQWVIDLRVTVVQLWDEKGQPPRVGYDEAEIIDQFIKMQEFVCKFSKKDEYTGQENIIRNTFNLGNAVNQFFPTMMKTRINYTKDTSAGKSIYDFFAKPELLETFITYASRHFKRDSFYHYSVPVNTTDTTKLDTLPDTGIGWLQLFENGKYRTRKNWDYWLAPRENESEYTGYNEALKGQSYFHITQKELDDNIDLIPEKCRTNTREMKENESYLIRFFERGQKVFPVGLKAFRVSFCQYAVNFPPLTAKYIYETYTERWKKEPNIYVWDPSSGWGGRLLGAMAVEDRRHLVYLGNDPNTDHNTTPGRTKYHEIVDFYTKNVTKNGGDFLKCLINTTANHTGFHFWQKGSEEMQFDPEFQKYKGKLSLVFTSPPYFAKEAYSEDVEQSYKKFSQYDLWRDGFLKETLKTAVAWLRPGGYLAWNIADADFGGETLPLEQDSKDILLSEGMIEREMIKMSLAQMPGGNRLDPVTGLPKAKNFCKVKGMWLKYEPIFIYQKPE